ncbi:rhodanese-like domain-containing protein [Desulfocurvus sp. DL9XJH121]
MKRFVLLFLLAFCSATMALAADFPLRDKPEFKDLAPVSTADLHAWVEKGQAVIVDVRSSEEYGVIHVNGARHIPISQKDFLAQLEKVRGKADAKNLAFYCNGVTCAKSYKACRAAKDAGFANVFVYDAGVPHWVEVYPAETTLLGKSPADPAKLISKAQFKDHLVDFAAFKAKASAGAEVIDIRDPMQRKDQLPDVAKVKSIPFERLIPLLTKGAFKGKNLLVFDAVGKQVRWLQYYLEDAGQANYLFLEGGVRKAIQK